MKIEMESGKSIPINANMFLVGVICSILGFLGSDIYYNSVDKSSAGHATQISNLTESFEDFKESDKEDKAEIKENIKEVENAVNDVKREQGNMKLSLQNNVTVNDLLRYQEKQRDIDAAQNQLLQDVKLMIQKNHPDLKQ